MRRETYFTPETITARSRTMLEALSSFRARHANIVLDLKRSALLVLDMQDYFLQEDSHAFIPSAPAILPNIQLLIDNYRSANRPIIFTRHLNTDANAGMMARWWRDVIHPSTPLSEITAFDTAKDIVIEKSQYDAFHASSLQETLSSRGVDQVVIAGVMTHLCCETTARAAFVRGYEIFFCIDGTATYTEELHRASLLNLSHGFALPVECKELIK